MRTRAGWGLVGSLVSLGLLTVCLFLISPSYLAQVPQVVIFSALLAAASAWALWSTGSSSGGD